MCRLGFIFVTTLAAGSLAACDGSGHAKRSEVVVSKENQICLSLEPGQTYVPSGKSIDYDGGVLHVGQAAIDVYAGWQPPFRGGISQQDVTGSEKFVLIRRANAGDLNQALWARKYEGHIGNLYVLFSGPDITSNPLLLERNGLVHICSG